MNKEKLKQLSKSLYFDLNEDQLSKLENEFIELEKKIEALKKIDTENIPVSNFCVVSSNSCLRKDELKPTANNKKHLSNAKKVINDYVVIK